MSKRRAHNPIGREVLHGLTEDQWRELYGKLRFFIARRYHGPLRDDDLIAKAYIDVIEGRRTWDPDRSAFINLAWIVRSIAFNQLQKTNRNVSVDGDFEWPARETELAKGHQPSLAEILLEDESYERLLADLECVVEGDSVLRRILNYLIRDPFWKPKEIATALEITQGDVYNARKRLRRKLRPPEGKTVSHV